MLESVTQAARESEASSARLREIVAQEHRAGTSPTDLAKAAGVTRQTIYRWLALEGEGAKVPNPEAAIREALRMLLPHLGPYEAEQVVKRIDGDAAMLLRALKMAKAGLPPAAKFDDEERACLGLAAEAQVLLQRRHDG